MPLDGLPYQNPFRAVGGQTFGGGSSNAMLALQDPSKARLALLQARRRSVTGMGAPVGQQDLYSDTSHGSFGFGGGDGRGQPQSAGTGDPRLNVDSTQRGARIGNLPGTMSAPSPTSPGGDSGGGGLQGLYEMNRTDPITGLAAMPSANDHLQYNKGLEQGGQFGPEAIGNQYLDAQASGNPNAMNNAAGSLNSFRNARQFIQQSPGRQNAGAGRQAVGAGRASGPGLTYNPDTGQWMPGLATGGPEMPNKPYMVGEKGPEEFEGIDGFKQLIGMNGPEVGTFDQPGKVIPNDQLKIPIRMENPRIQLQQVTHRAGGGDVDGGLSLHRHVPRGAPLPLPFSPRSPLGKALQSGVSGANRMTQGAINAVKYPFVEPSSPNVTSPADLLLPENYGPSGIAPLPTELQGDEYTNLPMTSPPANVDPEFADLPVGDPFAGPAWSFEGNNTFASPSPLPSEITPLDQSMYSRGATELPSTAPMTRQFQLQVPERGFSGTGSVSAAPRTKEAMIEGAPASEWFARAANRQGIANRFASVPTDSAAPALNSRMMRNNRRTSIGLPMGA